MRSSRFYVQFFHAFLLTVFILICYSNTFNASWHFDDYPNIVDNDRVHISSVSRVDLKKSLGSSWSRPLAYFSFALNYLVSGEQTTSYHVVNIAVHILAAFFVYLIFQQTLALYGKKHPFNGGLFSIQDIALLGALMWALHPIQTQAVTYIVQRMASMAALFYLVSFYSYIRCRVTERKFVKIGFMFLAAVFWSAGGLTKENVVVLPLAILAYEAAFLQTSLALSKRFIVFFLLFVVIVAVFGFVYVGGEPGEFLSGAYEIRPYGLWQRVITEPIILFRYLMLILLPIADFLSLESDFVASGGLIDPPVTLLAGVALVLLTLFSIRYLQKLPIVCFAVLFFLINHIVESSIIGLELYFEHRNYLPSVFIYLAGAYYWARLILLYESEGKVFLSRLFVVAMTLIVLSEANATYLRNDDWRTEIGELKRSVEHAPLTIRPYVSLGAIYSDRGEYLVAKEWLKKAEKLYKQYPKRYQENIIALIFYNAGVVEAKMKNADKAIRLFNYSLKFNERDWQTHLNLGLLLFSRGAYDTAEKFLFNAYRLKKGASYVFVSYGRTLYANDKIAEAAAVFQEGVNRFGLTGLRLNLIASYIAQGNLRLARSELRSVGPDGKVPVYRLYVAYLYSGNKREIALEKAAESLLANNVDYCGWMDKVRENASPGIIYPDVTEFESQLRQEFLALVQQKNSLWKGMYEKVDNCIGDNMSSKDSGRH